MVEQYRQRQKETATSRPLLKWAGGKSMILESIIPRFLASDMIKNNQTYIEPFVGSGAVAFALHYPRMILNDKNIKLMNFHEQVKQRPEKLYRKIQKYIEQYEKHKNLQEKENFYYKTRNKYNSLVLTKGNGLVHASLFWFLNKTCFNGMYRETKRGDFNIPFGKRDCPIPVLESFILVSSILKNSLLMHKPFDTVYDLAKTGDIVYLDPPYIPVSSTASFSDYLRYGFNLDNHKKLCRIMNELSDRGVYVVMSNSDCPVTRQIYGDLRGFKFSTIEVRRFISGKASGRKKITELIISNERK